MATIQRREAASAKSSRSLAALNFRFKRTMAELPLVKAIR
jgi:hypothetical protein